MAVICYKGSQAFWLLLRRHLVVLFYSLSLWIAGSIYAVPANADFQEFRSIVIETLNRMENVSKVEPGKDDETLNIKLKKPEQAGDNIQFYLGNAFREYDENPADVNEILERYLGVVRQAAETKPFSTDRLFALLRPTDYILDADRKYVQSTLAKNKPLDWKLQTTAFDLYGADMMVSLVMDEGDRFTTVQSKHLLGHDLSLKSASKFGIRNLKATISETEFKEIRGVWHLFTDQGSLTSSLLLDKDLWTKKAKKFPNGLIAAIPAREVVLFVEAGSINRTAKLTKRASAYYAETSHPQSTYLFYWENGNWRPREQIE